MLHAAINKVKQQLHDQIESKGEVSTYKTFSEHITESIQLRLRAITEKRISDNLEQRSIVGDETYICADAPYPNVYAIKYDDGSAWMMCPLYSWYREIGLKDVMKLGCRKKNARCSWFTQDK